MKTVKEKINMNKIKCPNCGETFTVDETSYSAILKQVKDKEFNREIENRIQIEIYKNSQMYEEKLEREKEENVRLNERLKAFDLDQDKAIKLKLGECEKEYQEKIKNKDIEIERLKSNLDSQKIQNQRDINLAVSQKDQEIEKLKGQLNANNTEKQLAVSDAVKEKEHIISSKDQEIMILKGTIENLKNAFEIEKEHLEKEHNKELYRKDEEIAYYKDYKLQSSTKMLGETLEQHCQNEFNRFRSMGFQSAYFEKDNDARTGSKGDYIFKDFDDDGMEFISIMFEMKNEADDTLKKRKNEDFFKELDKDRREKNCEYAILVSLLESDSELYNSGIVDVSYKYPKMYVVRPQFFIPIITLLRNASLNSIQYKRQLIKAENQNIDVKNFEAALDDFKSRFGRDYRLASERFADAIQEIDKSIDHLQRIKQNLLKSDDHLRLANNKAQDLSIKQLTKNNPTMKAKFDELNS